jgi:hypothetical protein
MANWYAKQVSVAGEWEAQDFTASPLPPVTITGDLAATEAQDLATAIGQMGHNGSFTVIDPQDGLVASGFIVNAAGSLAPLFIVNMGRMMSR